MKKLLLKAKLLLATVFGGLDKLLDQHADEAIMYSTWLKKIVESPIIGVLVKLTPTTLDDAAIAISKPIISKVVAELTIVKKCSELSSDDDRNACFVQALKDVSPAIQEAIYMKYASLFAKYKSGLNVRQSAFDTAIQTKFFEGKV